MRAHLLFISIAILLSMNGIVISVSVNAQNLSQAALPQANAFLDVSFKHINAFIDDVQINEININDSKNISVVAIESIGELPLNIAILLDTSGSQRGYSKEVLRFCIEMIELLPLRSIDSVSLIAVNDQTRVIQEGTSDKSLLRNGFKKVQYSRTTRLNDAIYSVSDAFGDKKGSRKAMIILSDGMDNASTRTMGEAYQKAAANNVRVYMFAKDEQEDLPPFYRREGSAWRMDSGYHAKFIKITGGQVFPFINIKSAEEQFIQMMDELSHLKRIGLSVDAIGKPLSGWKMSVSRKGVNAFYPSALQYNAKADK